MARRSSTGSKRTETIGWGIEVRNTKSVAIDLVITDQIPVPINADISIDLHQHDANAIDSRTGMLTWHDRIASTAAIRHMFSYSVRAPRGMPLVLE